MKVQLVDVGPRDGLQNEEKQLSLDLKVELIQKLSFSGLKRIEIGAFVNPQKVPQMANSKKVVQNILLQQKNKNLPSDIRYSALVPNEKGMREALTTDIQEVAFFTASSQSFARKNINCTIEESFIRLEEIIKLAKPKKLKIRAYLSTCFGCPYEGDVPEKQVLKVIDKLMTYPIYELSIGDTIGVATPRQVESLLKKVIKKHGTKKIAMHFHDTRSTALTNILKSFELGIRVFDSSLGGLGGCPYAPGAAGNVATEDVVYLFEKMGVKTGVDLDKLIKINQWLSTEMNKSFTSKVARAGGFLKPKGKVI